MNHSQDQGNVLPCGALVVDALVVDALKVHLDDSSFSYAALMLQKFR